jgi:hypothetical protein
MRSIIIISFPNFSSLVIPFRSFLSSWYSSNLPPSISLSLDYQIHLTKGNFQWLYKLIHQRISSVLFFFYKLKSYIFAPSSSFVFKLDQIQHRFSYDVSNNALIFWFAEINRRFVFEKLKREKSKDVGKPILVKNTNCEFLSYLHMKIYFN